MAQKAIRFIAQMYDVNSGNVMEESILQEEVLSKAETLKELGYLHIQQIDFLQKIQDFKLGHQITLNCLTVCPVCHSKTKKTGTFTSRFHAALTDHEVIVQRRSCNCGWSSKSSIEGIYGSSIHPDLLAKQALQGSKESYEKSSKTLNAESVNIRSVNSHSQIYKSVKSVGQTLETIKCSEGCKVELEPADVLIANIDGGHIKARGDNRSFEAMVATVYRPENLEYVNKSHNVISCKVVVASAKDDKQSTIKILFRNACKAEGMTAATKVTCLADGAGNCRSIAYTIASDCKEITYILDWFHIAMKFKNIAILEEHKDLYDKIKWHLWHGAPETAITRLEQLKILVKDSPTTDKLSKLAVYITNNKDGIVDYGARQNAGLAYTSNLAESMVNTLINDRQKGKQKMLWSRDGAHNILQIRASIFSNTWHDDFQKVESSLYKKAA